MMPTEPLDPLVGVATMLLDRYDAAFREANPMAASLLLPLHRDVVDELARGLVSVVRAVAASEILADSESLREDIAEVMADSVAEMTDAVCDELQRRAREERRVSA